MKVKVEASAYRNHRISVFMFSPVLQKCWNVADYSNNSTFTFLQMKTVNKNMFCLPDGTEGISIDILNIK